MKMNQFETMPESGRLQHFARRHQAGGVETKLRVLAATRRPFTGAFAIKPDTNANVRFDADFLGRANRLLELLEFFDDNDNRFAQLPAEQRDPNVGAVFIAVADDKALRVFVHGESSHQFRFTAGFQTEMKLLAGIDNLFNHFAQLNDLDRKNAAILTAIIEFGHGALKCAIDRFDAMTQQILKANDEGKAESA